MTTKKILPFYPVSVNGLLLSKAFRSDLVQSAMNYRPLPEDVFVVTYPKCGTTWTLQIVMLILRKGKLPATNSEYFESMPFLELMGGEYVEKLTRPFVIKTHFPFNMTPFSPDAKYVFVARNPKDCCVSYYHHTTYFPGYRFTEGSFDDFFDVFINGKTDFGDYFDHLLSWYEHRNDSNVLILTYESMKADKKGSLMTIARFLGKEYAEELEKDPSLIEKILHFSSFEFMKDVVNKAYDEISNPPPEIVKDTSLPLGIRNIMMTNYEAVKEGFVSKSRFVRKGEVGDGDKFSPEQEKLLDKRIEEKTKGSDVMDLWKNNFRT